MCASGSLGVRKWRLAGLTRYELNSCMAAGWVARVRIEAVSTKDEPGMTDAEFVAIAWQFSTLHAIGKLDVHRGDGHFGLAFVERDKPREVR